MGSFGERMRREREKRGVTLESISTTTKIRIHILEALEKEEFDKLPGGIVNKGFVRSYARFLGMNEEQVLKEFVEVAGDPEQPLPNPSVSRRPAIRQSKGRRSWGVVATVVVCAVALLFGGWKSTRIVRHAAGAAWSSVRGTRSQPAMTPAESVATKHVSSNSSQGNEPPPRVLATDQAKNAATATLQPASQKTTTAATELVPAAATTGTENFVILVKANEPAWISITADDQPFFEGVLQRKKKIRAHSQVVLKTNNAGALAVSRNGKRLPPLGNLDQQATVTFTPDGVTQTSETGEADSEGRPHVTGGSDHQEPARDDPQRPQSPGSSDTPPDT